MLKLLERLSGLTMLAGFMVLLGAAGASDNNTMEFTSIIIWSLVGVVLMLSGFVGLKATGSKYVA